MTDRVSKIFIKGIRTLKNVQLDLKNVTVLIGENGTGKSSILEAIEIIKKILSNNFIDDFNGIHGGFFALTGRQGNKIELGINIDGESGPLKYSITLTSQPWGGMYIENEYLDLGPLNGETEPLHVIKRDQSGLRVFDQSQSSLVDLTDKIPNVQPALSAFGVLPPQEAIFRMYIAISQMSVHLPFEVTPTWAARSHQRTSSLRGSSTLQTANQLERFGVNLVNCFQDLKNSSESEWRETMDLVRLGLGDEVENVNLKADPGGGALALSLKYKGLDSDIPAVSISDGQLSYLAFVALYKLHKNYSLLAFDEPETHLNPTLLVRVLSFFEKIGEQIPVILCTHSDRLLDLLNDPADSVFVCTLNGKRETEIVRPDPDRLGEWMNEYSGLGEIRAAGHLKSILRPR